MRNEKQIQTEIKRLRYAFKSGKFNEEVQHKVWGTMIALQWALTDKETMSLSALDLCGIPDDESTAIKKLAKRQI